MAAFDPASLNAERPRRPFKQTLNDKRHYYAIYKLEQPLNPGETVRMDFRMEYDSHGFRDGNDREGLAYNGTFFDRRWRNIRH